MMNAMFNNSKLMDRFFRKVDNVVWDLMSGRVGIKTREGIVTIEGEGDDAAVTLNLFEQFGIEVPAFAQNTPVAAVAVGDLIYGSKGPLGWVVEKNEKSFKLIKEDGTKTSWTPPKVATFGFDSGVMVLRSLVNMLPGGNTALNGMQSVIMPMLMMNEDLDLGSLMPMMMMGQFGNPAGTPEAAASQNQMMQMMQMMMMTQLLKPKSGDSKSKSTKTIFD